MSDEAIAMVPIVRQILSKAKTDSNRVAVMDSNPDLLLQWIMERQAFNFRDAVKGAERGFLWLQVLDTTFIFGIFFHLTADRSFAIFIPDSIGPNAMAAVGMVDRLIDGGSILMTRMNASRTLVPNDVEDVLNNGVGYPLRL